MISKINYMLFILRLGIKLWITHVIFFLFLSTETIALNKILKTTKLTKCTIEIIHILLSEKETFVKINLYLFYYQFIFVLCNLLMTCVKRNLRKTALRNKLISCSSNIFLISLD